MAETKRFQRCGKCGEPIDIPPEAAPFVALGEPLCQDCFEEWQKENPPPPAPVVEQRQSKYVFTSDMGEISGFGGGYEQTCRNMLAAGLEWLDEHPDADPKFQGMKGVFGVIFDDNEDAKALSDAVVEGADGDCTGAMHQAVVGSCLWIKENGWDAYCAEMSKEGEDQ
jgi:hypothetical protein